MCNLSRTPPLFVLPRPGVPFIARTHPQSIILTGQCYPGPVSHSSQGLTPRAPSSLASATQARCPIHRKDSPSKHHPHWPVLPRPGVPFITRTHPQSTILTGQCYPGPVSHSSQGLTLKASSSLASATQARCPIHHKDSPPEHHPHWPVLPRPGVPFIARTHPRAPSSLASATQARCPIHRKDSPPEHHPHWPVLPRPGVPVIARTHPQSTILTGQCYPGPVSHSSQGLTLRASYSLASATQARCPIHRKDSPPEHHPHWPVLPRPGVQVIARTHPQSTVLTGQCYPGPVSHSSQGLTPRAPSSLASATQARCPIHRKDSHPRASSSLASATQARCPIHHKDSTPEHHPHWPVQPRPGVPFIARTHPRAPSSLAIATQVRCPIHRKDSPQSTILTGQCYPGPVSHSSQGLTPRAPASLASATQARCPIHCKDSPPEHHPHWPVLPRPGVPFIARTHPRAQSSLASATQVRCPIHRKDSPPEHHPHWPVQPRPGVPFIARTHPQSTILTGQCYPGPVSHSSQGVTPRAPSSLASATQARCPIHRKDSPPEHHPHWPVLPRPGVPFIASTHPGAPSSLASATQARCPIHRKDSPQSTILTGQCNPGPVSHSSQGLPPPEHHPHWPVLPRPGVPLIARTRPQSTILTGQCYPGPVSQSSQGLIPRAPSSLASATQARCPSHRKDSSPEHHPHWPVLPRPGAPFIARTHPQSTILIGQCYPDPVSHSSQGLTPRASSSLTSATQARCPIHSIILTGQCYPGPVSHS